METNGIQPTVNGRAQAQRDEIEQQVAEFEARGGEIKVIPFGVGKEALKLVRDRSTGEKNFSRSPRYVNKEFGKLARRRFGQLNGPMVPQS